MKKKILDGSLMNVALMYGDGDVSSIQIMFFVHVQ